MKTNKILFSILVFIFASCTPSKTEEPFEFPPFSIPDDVTFTDNNDLTIQVPDKINTFRAGDALNILIFNMSDKEFVFNYHDVKIYELKFVDSIWQEVFNNVIIIDNGEVRIKGGDSILTFFNPSLSTNNEDNAFVKIIIIGKFSGNNGKLEDDKKVMMIDIKLNQ